MSQDKKIHSKALPVIPITDSDCTALPSFAQSTSSNKKYLIFYKHYTVGILIPDSESVISIIPT